jgi:phage terminase large subunit
MAKIDIQLPEKLGAIFSGKADYRGAHGGRGGAKTRGFASMAIIDVIRLNDTPWKFLCCRELQKSIEDSVFSVISSEIVRMGVQDQFDVGRKYIRHHNGNEFLFYGLRSNIAEVKGLNGVRRTWIEEGQGVSNNSLEYLEPTVMRDFEDCEIWASWNPEDEEDPIHAMFVNNADKNFKTTQINWDDNPWFPKSLNKIRLRDKENKPHIYNWKWEGGFNVNMEASVYGKWMEKAKREGRIREDLYDPALPVYTSWDIGYSDDTAIWWWQVVGGEIRFIDYYEMNREDIKHYAEQIYGMEIIVKERDLINGRVKEFELGATIEGLERRHEYTYGNHYAPHDAANKLFQAGGRSTVQQFYDFGIEMKIVPSTSQQNQIDATRGVIDISYYDINHCKDGIRCMRKYQFKKNENKNSYSKEPDHDLGGYSHGCDAHEIVAQVWKSAKLAEPKDKPKFLEQMTINQLFEEQPNGGYERI